MYNSLLAKEKSTPRQIVFTQNRNLFKEKNNRFIVSDRSEISHSTFAAEAAFIRGVTPHKTLTPCICLSLSFPGR